MNQKTINDIVKRSKVEEGEVILIQYWGEQEHLGIADSFMEAVVQRGASPLFLWQSRERNQKFFGEMKQEVFGEKYFELFSSVDAVLDIFAYQPVILSKKLPDEQMNYYRNYMKQFFQTLMTKERFVQIRIPTVANANESGLSADDFIERMEAAYDVSYDQMALEMERDKVLFDQADKIEIHTAQNCKLSFSTKGREFIPDCGDGDWPCGELYLPPVEDQTNGEVFFEKLFVEDVGAFENVKFVIHNGSISDCSDGKMKQWLDELSEQDRVVCELGFGYNANVTSLCGYTVLDEKMKGTFHFAIGDNQMFGGTNKGTIHVDFVGEGTIEIKEGKSNEYN